MKVLYIHDEVVHNYKAANEVLPFVVESFQPTSILDVGCGIGTWLKVAKELGVKEVIGVDGSYTNRNLLKIDTDEFVEKDLRQSFELKRKFDLVLCLEVAEHLPKESAENLITSLCFHSDTIIFSAAIPGQGGQNHINEQWPSYWADLFSKKGFHTYDLLRPVFWNNINVDFWYKQNMIVFSKISLEHLYKKQTNQEVNGYVHPELFKKVLEEIKLLKTQIENEEQKPGVKKSFLRFLKSLGKKLLS